MTTAQTIIDDLIRREGSEFSNHPADKGGPTKYGITQRTLQRHREAPVSIDDVRNLTETEARMIYWKDYVDGPGFALIQDPALVGLLVDSSVQHGADDAIAWLQRALKVKVDGKLGPVTATAANSRPLRTVYAEVLAQRCSYYGRLVSDDPKRVQAAIAGFRLQAENAAGWNNRLAEFIRQTAVL